MWVHVNDTPGAGTHIGLAPWIQDSSSVLGVQWSLVLYLRSECFLYDVKLMGWRKHCHPSMFCRICTFENCPKWSQQALPSLRMLEGNGNINCPKVCIYLDDTLVFINLGRHEKCLNRLYWIWALKKTICSDALQKSKLCSVKINENKPQKLQNWGIPKQSRSQAMGTFLGPLTFYKVNGRWPVLTAPGWIRKGSCPSILYWLVSKLCFTHSFKFGNIWMRDDIISGP